MTMQAVPLSPSFGAEIRGIDLTREPSIEEAQFIRDTWINAGVLLIRNAAHDDAAQMRFSQLFGEMEPGAVKFLNNSDNPYLMTLKNDPEAKSERFNTNYVVGGIERAGWLGWHWDQSFMPTIVRGAVLRMVHVPGEMGRTGFIDAIAAYERLPDAMKQRIEGLEVVYRFNPQMASGQFGFPADIVAVPKDDGAAPRSDGKFATDFPPCVHPLVITQAETGRKVLKLSPMHARYVLGMDQAESDALLIELAAHLCDERHAYWHRWQLNDMVVWDNWRVIHGAEGVPPQVKRVAMRTTIMGDYKVGRYLDPALARDREVERLVD